ncbi:MAG: cupin domain-containing protein [Syntrophales bacterium]
MERINLKEKEVFKKEGRGMANLVDEPYLLINQVCLEPGQNVPEHQANSNVTLQVVSGEGTFMAMHLSDDRQNLFKKVETLIDGMPEPDFYEVVVS